MIIAVTLLANSPQRKKKIQANMIRLIRLTCGHLGIRKNQCFGDYSPSNGLEALGKNPVLIEYMTLNLGMTTFHLQSQEKLPLKIPIGSDLSNCFIFPPRHRCKEIHQDHCRVEPRHRPTLPMFLHVFFFVCVFPSAAQKWMPLMHLS